MRGNTWSELTENQRHKARLGSGHALARAFTAEPCGILLLATDGLFDYLELDAIARVLRSPSDNVAHALVQLLRDRYRRPFHSGTCPIP